MNKFNSRAVIILFFLMMAGVFWLYMESKNRETLRAVEVYKESSDSSRVDRISIQRMLNDDPPYLLFLENGLWKLDINDTILAVDQDRLKDLSSRLTDLRITKITGKGKKMWSRYGLEPERSTRLIMLSESDTLLVAAFGRFDMSSRLSIGKTYFLIGDREEIFESPGNLGVQLSQDPDIWSKQKATKRKAGQ